MKALLRLLICIPALLPAANNKIAIGDTEAEVTAALGKPVGNVVLRNRSLWLYPQGEVTIKDGAVDSFNLMDDATFAAHQKQLEAERLAHQERQQALKAQRIQEGKALKAEKQQSQAFAALPAKQRADYWRSFQITYPDIDVSDQLEAAIASYQSEIKELEDQEKIAALEARVAKAEKESAQARLEAEKARKDAESLRSTRESLRYYYDGPRRSYYYRPPTVIIYPGVDDDCIEHF